MSYDKLFLEAGAESLIERRLREEPGQELLTMKMAGFKATWDSFVRYAIDHDWTDAVRAAGAIDKRASHRDLYQDGRLEAAEFIEHLDQVPEVRGWYRFLKHAQMVAKKGQDVMEFCKVADSLDLSWPARELEGFHMAAYHMQSSGDDIIKMAQIGPSVVQGLTKSMPNMSGLTGAGSKMKGMLDFAQNAPKAPSIAAMARPLLGKK
jgi:hypothetical protein